MNILFLGPHETDIIMNLKYRGFNVVETEDPIDLKFLDLNDVSFGISYRYRYIIKPEIISRLVGRVVNLHISLLPWNRGADPNLWSFLENTPKGVSIHYIDAGIDTGDVIIQQEVKFNDDLETLSSTYYKLNYMLKELFIANINKIIDAEFPRYKQKEKGSFHRLSDKNKFLHLLTKGWDTPVKELIGKGLVNGY